VNLYVTDIKISRKSY